MANSSNEESQHINDQYGSGSTGREADSKDASTKNSTSSCSKTMIKISAWLIPPSDIFLKLQKEIEQ